MNSIKSLATLMILAVIGGYLYLKITETEMVLPPEAADLSYDVPQIDLEGGAGASGLVPPDGVAGQASAFGPSSGATAAPPYDPSMANSAAPAWSGTPSNTQTTATDASSVSPIRTPPPIALPSDAPPGVGANGPPANPFDGPTDTTARATESVSVGSAGNVTPNSTTLPPPGSLGASKETVIEGRVYDEPPLDSEMTAVIAPPDTPQVSNVAAAPAISKTPHGTSSMDVALQTVEGLLAQQQYAEALRILTEYYRDPSLSPSDQKEVDSLLSQLAGTVIYSTEHQLEPPHRVALGETLSAIAERHNVSPEILAKIHGIADPNSLKPGANLKIVRGPFMAIVDLTHREMTLMLDGRYAGRFPIGVGKDQPPAEGQWVVAAKEHDPEYVGADQLIAGGDPSNPFGRRILILGSPKGDPSGFGIHGSPAGGETDPRGSIRLSSTDAADVFDILSIGSKVIVRR